MMLRVHYGYSLALPLALWQLGSATPGVKEQQPGMLNTLFWVAYPAYGRHSTLVRTEYVLKYAVA